MTIIHKIKQFLLIAYMKRSKKKLLFFSSSSIQTFHSYIHIAMVVPLPISSNCFTSPDLTHTMKDLEWKLKITNLVNSVYSQKYLLYLYSNEYSETNFSFCDQLDDQTLRKEYYPRNQYKFCLKKQLCFILKGC